MVRLHLCGGVVHDSPTHTTHTHPSYIKSERAMFGALCLFLSKFSYVQLTGSSRLARLTHT